MVSGLDSKRWCFKDHILTSEVLPSAANVYSQLLRSSLSQSFIVAPSKSFTLITSSGCSSGSHNSHCNNHGGHDFQGGFLGDGHIGGRIAN